MVSLQWGNTRDGEADFESENQLQSWERRKTFVECLALAPTNCLRKKGKQRHCLYRWMDSRHTLSTHLKCRKQMRKANPLFQGVRRNQCIVRWCSKTKCEQYTEQNSPSGHLKFAKLTLHFNQDWNYCNCLCIAAKHFRCFSSFCNGHFFRLLKARTIS